MSFLTLVLFLPEIEVLPKAIVYFCPPLRVGWSLSTPPLPLSIPLAFFFSDKCALSSTRHPRLTRERDNRWPSGELVLLLVSLLQRSPAPSPLHLTIHLPSHIHFTSLWVRMPVYVPVHTNQRRTLSPPIDCLETCRNPRHEATRDNTGCSKKDDTTSMYFGRFNTQSTITTDASGLTFHKDCDLDRKLFNKIGLTRLLVSQLSLRVIKLLLQCLLRVRLK